MYRPSPVRRCTALAAAAALLASASCGRTAPAAPPAGPAQTNATPSQVAVTPAIAAQIDRLMRRAVARQHLAGISLAIGHNGTVIFAKGYGYRDLARRLPATPETIYNIASMSKQFTAACVLLLQQDGRLNIDDHLSKYLPGFKNGDKVTIREVLDHTSGLTDYLDLLDNATLTPATVDAAVYKLKLKFPPGSKYEYSNSNYIVAGLIVSKVSGMPFDEFLRTRILRPLDLRSTTVGTSPLDLPGGSVGYTVVKGRTVPVDPKYDSAVTLDFPDGGINTNVLDLVKWDYALDSGRVIGPAMLKLMFAPSGLHADWPGGYALGVGLDTIAGHREVAHTGGWTGFTGENATLPDERFAVVMITNTDTFDFGGKQDLIGRIIGLFYH